MGIRNGRDGKSDAMAQPATHFFASSRASRVVSRHDAACHSPHGCCRRHWSTVLSFVAPLPLGSHTLHRLISSLSLRRCLHAVCNRVIGAAQSALPTANRPVGFDQRRCPFSRHLHHDTGACPSTRQLSYHDGRCLVNMYVHVSRSAGTYVLVTGHIAPTDRVTQRF